MHDVTKFIRIYVGGIPRNITKDELRQRFAPFGLVADVELIQEKDSQLPLAMCEDTFQKGCRGFAYINFQPQEEKSLHKCMTLVQNVVRFFNYSTFSKILTSLFSTMEVNGKVGALKLKLQKSIISSN